MCLLINSIYFQCCSLQISHPFPPRQWPRNFLTEIFCGSKVTYKDTVVITTKYIESKNDSVWNLTNSSYFSFSSLFLSKILMISQKFDALFGCQIYYHSFNVTVRVCFFPTHFVFCLFSKKYSEKLPFNAKLANLKELEIISLYKNKI